MNITSEHSCTLTGLIFKAFYNIGCNPNFQLGRPEPQHKSCAELGLLPKCLHSTCPSYSESMQK